MRSLAVKYGGIFPVKVNFIDSGILSQIFPVPRIKAASVLPTPVANIPNAPDVQVCESVPNKTVPGTSYPSSANAIWQTPLYLSVDRKSTRLNSSHLGISYA